MFEEMKAKMMGLLFLVFFFFFMASKTGVMLGVVP
jgi:hypothetical protein